MSRIWRVSLGFAVLLLAAHHDASAASFAIDIGIVGSDPIHITPDLVEVGPGHFLSTGQHVESTFGIAWGFQLEGDPAVVGSFTLTNLSSSPQTFSISATLGVLPLAGPTQMGGFFGDVTFTDLDNGFVELATVGATPFYRAQIDGASVQDLGSFDVTASAPGPGAFGIVPQQAWGVPIPSAPGPGVASSIGVAFPAFSLTGNDQVQVPFEFAVVPVPEPTSVVLVGLGLCGLVAQKSIWKRATN